MRTNVSPLKSAFWREQVRPFVAHRASFRCEHCMTYLGLTGDVDHIVPRSEIDRIGIRVFDPSNLQYLCPSCHSQKTNRERWAGHEKRARVPRRTALKGRGAFLDAAGIPETLPNERH